MLALPVGAVRLSNGQVAFNEPPQVVRAGASSVQASLPGTIYHFTITLPENAGESMQAVTITQRQNVENIAFEPEASRAFVGSSFRGSPMLSLASVGGPRPTANEVTLVFDPPVRPGSTVTVALQARNPRYGGTYLFGVTAFPVGENGLGQFLGYSRLNFASPDGG
ncbi:DUF2808 domain-containing protein [Leptolyngbya sp. FACHB-261]|nr:DUF2808 domain-containing protein [Leptolyngbya sp. FACHB-261]